jgi:hypothetical protein
MQRSRGLPLFRAALVTALAGHWIANSIADPIEYASVGLRYDGAALRPIILQSVIVALLVGLLTLASRLRLPQRWIHRDSSLTRTELALLLLGAQIGLSGLMEMTETLALGGAYAAAFRTGFLDVGFGVELLIAIVSALLLVALAIGLPGRSERCFPGPELAGTWTNHGARSSHPSSVACSPWLAPVGFGRRLRQQPSGVRRPPRPTAVASVPRNPTRVRSNPGSRAWISRTLLRLFTFLNRRVRRHIGGSGTLLAAPVSMVVRHMGRATVVVADTPSARR